jgi:hypothetical protein
MVENQTRAAAKAGSRQSKSGNRTSVGKGRRGKPKDGTKALFELKGTTVSAFTIGGGAVDVILSGTGLDLEGLDVAILDAEQDHEVPGDKVIFELPQKDDISPSEFPITVKVLAGEPGPRRLAVTLLLVTSAGPILVVSALPARLKI